MKFKKAQSNTGRKYRYIIKQKCRQALALLCCIGMLLPVSSIRAEAKDAGTAISIGIDVSKYQGNIDWSAVAASGVRYAFVRVGSTQYGIDTKFDQNMRMAAANGVKTGVYLYSYARNAQEAATEAMFVLQAIANYTVSMPVVIDIEDQTQRSLSPQALAEIANTFCAIIESAGYYPMVYASKNWFTEKIGPVAYDKWVAQYHTSCSVEDAAFWQATSAGSIPGISGRVDIDYQYKDLSASIVANGFVFRKGFFYFYENYKMKTNTFVQYNNGIYFVDQFGRRVSGFAQLGGSVFYFDANGLMQLGWQTLAGNIYYFGTDGKMAVGLNQIGDKIYMFDTNGCMYTGWLSADHLYYFYEDGHMAIGLSAIGNDHYYFNENGFIQVGWQNLGGQMYYFSPIDAKMSFGWVNDGTGIFYTDENGVMKTGLITVGGDQYFMGTDGRMQFGWQNLGGLDYCFDPASGKMLKGWAVLGTDRYYFDPASGAKQTGWLVLDGQTYYLGTDGRLAVGMQDIGGSIYFFNAEGKLQTGFLNDGVSVYYFDPVSAVMAKGWTAIDGSLYCFDPNTGQMYSGLHQIGESLYLFDSGGRLVVNQQTEINGNLYISDANGCVIQVPLQ